MTNNPTLLYVTFANLSLPGSGVSKKILGQFNAFKRLGFSVLYVCYDGEKFVLCEENQKIPLFFCKRNPGQQAVRLSFALRRALKNRQIDVLYVRSHDFLLLYDLFKKRTSKLVVEVPTTKIVQEIYANKKTSFTKRLAKVSVIKIIESFLLNSVDYFINFDGVSKIARKPAFVMNNCVDVTSIPLKKEVPKESNDVVTLIAVALMQYWQGYERIIRSLGEYKRRRGAKARKIRIFLVGDGQEIPYYRKLVEEYGLQNDVEFCGILSGKKLDEKFDSADLALGGFGMYKIDMYSSSKLKSKEYCARGIPFVDASNDIAFTGKEEFLLPIPNDDSEIDMEEILSFYDKISKLPNIRQRMRDFCKENFDWTSEYRRFFKESFGWDLVPTFENNITSATD